MTDPSETRTCIVCKKDFERRLKRGLKRILRKGIKKYGAVTCSKKCSTTYNHERGSSKYPNKYARNPRNKSEVEDESP